MGRLFAAFVVASAFALPARATGFDDFNRGVNANNRGDSATAIDSLSRALASKDLPENLRPIALLDRAGAYERQKRYDDAIADLNETPKLSPNDYDAIYRRMFAYAASKRGSLAEADCDTLLKMRGRAAPLYFQCGIVGFENGDFARAVPYFQTAVELEAHPQPFHVLWLEIARQRAGTPDDAQFARFAKYMDLDIWPAPIFNLYLGKAGPEAALVVEANSRPQLSLPTFLHLAPESPAPITGTVTSGSSNEALPTRRCLSAFFTAEWEIVHQNSGRAMELLCEAATGCPDALVVQTEIERLTPK